MHRAKFPARNGFALFANSFAPIKNRAFWWTFNKKGKEDKQGKAADKDKAAE